MKKIRLFQNTFHKFFLLVFLPCAVLLIASILIIQNTFYTTTTQIIDMTSANIVAFSKQCDTNIKNTILYTSALEQNENFRNALTNSTYNEAELQRDLSAFIQSYAFIDNVFILDKYANSVITQSGTIALQTYLQQNYHYESYSENYWKNFSFYENIAYDILSPSPVTHQGQTTVVFPVVIRRMNDTKLSKFVVLNISFESLISAHEHYLATENTKLYLLNRHSSQIFTIPNIQGKAEKELYDQLCNGESSFTYNFLGQKSLIVSYSKYENILGYTYFAVVPYSDIHKKLFPNILLSALLFILCAGVALLLVFKATKSVLQPLLMIRHILPTANSSKNIYEDIRGATVKLVKSNQKLSAILPFAQEKYLINFLNSTEYYIDEDSQKIISNSLNFKFDLFCVVIIQLRPRDALFEKYSSQEYSNIKEGFFNVVKNLFTDNFDAFFLSSEKETLYIITNFENEANGDQVTVLLNEICGYLANDDEYIYLYVGIGHTYAGIDGLKQSHIDATASLNIVPLSTASATISARKNNISFKYSNKDEMEISQALLRLDTNLALEKIKAVLENNQWIDDRSLKQLYLQILSLILKAIRIHKINTDDNKFEFEIYASFSNKTTAEIYYDILQYIELLARKAATYSPAQKNKNIIEFINQHACDPNLSLKTIAETFGTTPSNVSTLLKNALGIGFHTYITDLRIVKAKHALSSTNQTITEIYESTGFVTKQTFYRIFKSAVGMTPSEYRKSNKDSNHE